MSYNIGSNFNVSSKIPLDSRTVVDFINDLDNIQNKYEGLIVYCKEDEKYYKYINNTFEEFSNNLTDDYALKSYVGVKTVSGGTVDNPLKITSLQSDLPVVIRGGYLAFNNPSDNDNYSITIHCVTDSEPIMVLHTDVLYDAFDTGEPIEYVGDIVMLSNDIYGLYHYSINANTGEVTFSCPYTGDYILDKLKDVDGTGSGLDADLLDGKHAYQMVKYGYASGTLITNENDLSWSDTAGGQMYTFYDTSNLIGEGTNKFYGIMQIYYSASYYARIAISMSSGKIYRQTFDSTTSQYPSTWNEIVSSTPTIPILSSDPSNPSNGQMWIRSDL